MNLPITYIKNPSGGAAIAVRATAADVRAASPSAEIVPNSRELDAARRRGWLGREWTVNWRGDLVELLPEMPRLRDCKCGCDGNYTDHSMRAGESGRPSSVIVR